jgi:hypothetical protein
MKHWLILLGTGLVAGVLFVQFRVSEQAVPVVTQVPEQAAPVVTQVPPKEEHRIHPAFPKLLQRLEHECDPNNFDADYSWSTMAMPTEKNRAALLAEFRQHGTALLPDVKATMQRTSNDELRSMLLVTAVALGDKDSIVPAARTMVWSDFPAVRLSAARELRRLHDPRTIEWFQAAQHDERFVHNCDCQTKIEKYYPVRIVAEIALREMGVTLIETAQR